MTEEELDEQISQQTQRCEDDENEEDNVMKMNWIQYSTNVN